MASGTEIERLVVRLMGDGASFQRMLTQAESGVKRTTKIIQSAGKKIEAISSRIKNFGRSLTFRVTLPLLGLGAAAIKVGSDFESGFAGVKKTVDATPAQFAKLKEGFKDLAAEIPIASSELLGIGEVAGQLGIKSKDILSFTRVMADLSVTTNLSAEEAAIALARFANITGTSTDKFENLGSAIVALGNNFATSEAEIVNLASRLAGAGSTIGLSDTQILGMAASLSSLGLRAESSGTSMSKLFLEITTQVATGGKELDKFAKVAGQTTEEFVKGFDNNAGEAIQSFIIGLGKLAPKARIVALKDLGLDTARMADAMLRVSGNTKNLGGALDLAAKAFKENTALADEAAQRYETFGSQVILLKNQFKLLLGEAFEIMRPALIKVIDGVKKVVAMFREMSPEAKRLALTILAVAAAIGPLLIILGGLTGVIAPVVTAFGAILAGIAATTTAVVTLTVFAFTPLGAAMVLVLGIAGGLALAWAGLTDQTIELGGIVDWLKGKWDGLLDRFTDTWKGITNAVKAGDLALAFKIMWAEIKVIFEEAIGDIELNLTRLKIVLKRVAIDVKFGKNSDVGNALKAGLDIGQKFQEGVIKGRIEKAKQGRDRLVEEAAVGAKKVDDNAKAALASISGLGFGIGGGFAAGGEPQSKEDPLAGISNIPGVGDTIKNAENQAASQKRREAAGSFTASARGSVETAAKIRANRETGVEKVVTLMERLVELEEENKEKALVAVAAAGIGIA